LVTSLKIASISILLFTVHHDTECLSWRTWPKWASIMTVVLSLVDTDVWKHLTMSIRTILYKFCHDGFVTDVKRKRGNTA
jgi:hypothetical protein